MVQQIVIGVIFLGAVFYIGRIIYRSFQAKANCAANCGKCNTIDFNKIEEQLKTKASAPVNTSSID